MKARLPFSFRIFAIIGLFLFVFSGHAVGQSSGKNLYEQIASFKLVSGTPVTNETIKIDRVSVTLNGTIYFAAPVEGIPTGAVFVGTGKFLADVPSSSFEKDHVRRMLKADKVESDFTKAVFRFSDVSLRPLFARATAMAISPDVQKLATEHDARIVKQNGLNLAARISISILNKESPGIFFGSFEGGSIDEFSFVFDDQTRIPTTVFDLNGGEKGLIFRYRSYLYSSEVLMAFYSLSDYERRFVEYSDKNDLIDIRSYEMDLDLRSPKSAITLKTKIETTALSGPISAIPFALGESLSVSDDERKKKQLRVNSVKVGGQEAEFAQVDWEGGFTVFLSNEIAKGESKTIEVTMVGDFLEQPGAGFSYPRSTTSWYPRHGYLDRSEYKIKFVHTKDSKVVCVGNRINESQSPENKDHVITEYHMDHPISFATFALGPYLRKSEIIKWDGTNETLPLEFNTITTMPLKESFILAELNNSVRYFKKLFGTYPYKTYSASYHPYGFGQGFPSMLMIPGTDRANKYTYAFISHETAHQWWGNIVAWRSYRDQWLSEGFAEYSGVLYTGLRDSHKASINLIDEMRESLRMPPRTNSGVGKGKLNDIGPLILGHRLSSSKSFGGYQTLVYNKGALVLRMLHFLFTDPNSGNGDAFFDMMRDFVERYRNNTASTDDFRTVANEHFVKTPIAKKYNLNNLNWFFQQWVYETHFPSYKMNYVVEPQTDGTFLVSGNVLQENVPNNFFMPLPLIMKFGGDSGATGTVHALGPNTPFKIKLPMKPTSVTLDPSKWVLSEDTSTK
ncbi:MAG TPA: M1 family aminopeptidase [Pyrinomonadaceae bacterium]|nr:M1 family aminopeptidase [Pyrinomonadaceae bacterium]